MTSTKYIGMDVHKESISIAVRNAAGKIVRECVIETKANILLDFIHGLRGELQVTFEEGTWATWLCDLLKPHGSVKGQLQKSKKQVAVRGLNRDCNHDLKNLFESAATIAFVKPGPFQEFYAALLPKG